MEVVLSPGRFGDEASGAPFQNEEIREWSHVDRLTGMLERARVETGRWQTSIQGAARSYGKVIDSRERNSADGSVVQRARRQVEVFQSQGPGRSVQVVRASQWSSSRVTDSMINGPQALSSTAQKEEKSTDKFAGLCRLSPPPSSSLRRDEAISERLSSLLGSFTYPVSSTVPLRRIDSKYASRTPISLTTSKRFSSNENVSLRDENRADFASTTKLLRESKNQPVELFPEKNDFSPRADAEEIANVRVHAINIEREDRQRVSIQEINDLTSEKNSFEEIRPAATTTTTTTATKAAIHLLPSSKANTTVVNLMNSGHAQSWLPNASHIAPESRLAEAKTAETVKNRSDDSSATMSGGSAGRVKRVGFCKTEIHFAADSGKVNIVETDGKPPPTNKFRRRKRSATCNKSAPMANTAIANYDETLGNVVAKPEVRTEEKKKENDPNLHRGHTTTVNLGNDFPVNDERTDRAEESSHIVESLEKEDNSSTAVPALISVGNSSKPERAEDYNVLCTDAENNQVLLKVVTTHEPTIARVESDHLRKKTIVTNNLPPAVPKKEHRSNAKTAKSEIPNKEHTYVNIFTYSKRAPIYENYKISDNEKRDKNKICPSATNDAKIVKEKILRPDVKHQSFAAASKSKESENTKIDKMDTVVESKMAANSHVEDISKKIRSKTKETKLPVKSKSSRPEVSSSIATPSGTPRVRSSNNNNSKISTSKKPSIRSQDESISSGERVARSSGGSLNGNKTNVGKSTRDVVASVKAIKKNDGTTKNKPMEVVYQTAVYNMKNERLSRPQKGKESKGPRYLNELICGAKTKRVSESKSKTSSHPVDKSASQTVRHWK